MIIYNLCHQVLQIKLKISLLRFLRWSTEFNWNGSSVTCNNAKFLQTDFFCSNFFLLAVTIYKIGQI